MIYSHNQLYTHIYTQKHNDAMKTSGHSSLEKYTSHFIERVVYERSCRPNKDCNILTPPQLFGLSQLFFPVLMGCSTGGLGAQSLLGHGSHSSIFLQLIWTSCRRGYIIIWHPPTSCERHNSHSIQPLDSQGRPLISSTGCTCYLHWCISSFDSLAGVSMQCIDR